MLTGFLVVLIGPSLLVPPPSPQPAKDMVKTNKAPTKPNPDQDRQQSHATQLSLRDT
jgi:hypothetical protein